MSDVVKVLEYLGQNPDPLSDRALAGLVAEAGLDTEASAIVLSRRPELLAKILNAPTITFCGLATPEEEQPIREDEPSEDDDGRDFPDKKDASSLAA